MSEGDAGDRSPTPGLSIEERLDLLRFKPAEDIVATQGGCLSGYPHTPVIHRQNPPDFIDKLMEGLNFFVNVHQPTRLDIYRDIAADYLPGHTPEDIQRQYHIYGKNAWQVFHDANLPSPPSPPVCFKCSITVPAHFVDDCPKKKKISKKSDATLQTSQNLPTPPSLESTILEDSLQKEEEPKRTLPNTASLPSPAGPQSFKRRRDADDETTPMPNGKRRCREVIPMQRVLRRSERLKARAGASG